MAFGRTNVRNIPLNSQFQSISQAEIQRDPTRYSQPVVSVNTQVGDHEEILSVAAVKVVMDYQTGKARLLDFTERYYLPKVVYGKTNNTQGKGHEYGQRTFSMHGLNRKELTRLRNATHMGSVTEFNQKEQDELRRWAGNDAIWASHEFNAFTSRHLLKYNTNGQSSIDTYVAAVNKYGMPRANQVKELKDLYKTLTGSSMASSGFRNYDAMSHAAADVKVLERMMKWQGESGSAIKYILQNQNIHNVLSNFKYGAGSQLVQGNYHVWDKNVDPKFIGPSQVGSVQAIYLRNYLQKAQYSLTQFPKGGNRGMPGIDWNDINSHMTPWIDALTANTAASIPNGRSNVLKTLSSLYDLALSPFQNKSFRQGLRTLMPGITRSDINDMAFLERNLKKAQEVSSLAASNLALDTGVYQGKYKNTIAQSMGFINGIDDIKAMKAGADRINATWELGARTSAYNNFALLNAQGKITKGDVDRLSELMPGSLEQNIGLWEAERDKSFRNEVKDARRHRRISGKDYEQLIGMQGDTKGRKAFDDATKSMTKFNEQVKLGASAFNKLISSFHTQFFDPRRLAAADEEGMRGAIERLDFLPKQITKPLGRLGDYIHRAMDIQLSGIGRAIDTWKGMGGNIQAIGGIGGSVAGALIGSAVPGIGTTTGAMVGSALGQLPGAIINIASQVRGNRAMKQVKNFWSGVQGQIDVLGFIVDIVSVPFKALAKATQSLIGMFTHFSVSLPRFISGIMGSLNQMIYPLTTLTGIGFPQSQKLGALDSFFGLGSGSINGSYESWASRGQALFTLGQVDTQRMYPAFLTSMGPGFGWDVMLGHFEEALNRALRAPELKPSDMMSLQMIDPVLARMVELGRLLKVTDIKELMPGNFTYNGVTPQLNELSTKETEHFLRAGQSYQIISGSIKNDTKRIGVALWDMFGLDLYNGFSRALHEASQGHWDRAWDELIQSISKAMNSIRKTISGALFEGDVTKGWKDIIRKVWSTIKTEILGWAGDSSLFSKIGEGFTKIIDVIQPAISSFGHMWISFVFDLVRQLKEPINNLLNSLGRLQVDPQKLSDWVSGKIPLGDAFGIVGTESEFVNGAKASIYYGDPRVLDRSSGRHHRFIVKEGSTEHKTSGEGTILDSYNDVINDISKNESKMSKNQLVGQFYEIKTETPNGLVTFYSRPNASLEEIYNINKEKGVYDAYIKAMTTLGKRNFEYLDDSAIDKAEDFTHLEFDTILSTAGRAAKGVKKVGGEYVKKGLDAINNTVEAFTSPVSYAQDTVNIVLDFSNAKFNYKLAKKDKTYVLDGNSSDDLLKNFAEKAMNMQELA